MNDRLRVAHLTPTHFSSGSVLGGGERYVQYLARAVQAVGGFEQCVFAIGAEDGILEQDGITLRVLRNESALPGKMDGFSAALWQELPGFDLVHIHQSLTLFGAHATAIVRSLGMPAIGTDLGGGQNDLMLRGRGLMLLDGVISISGYARSLVAAAFDGPHEVMIGPVDTDLFCPSPLLARNGATVLCVGRILPHKGVDRVIAALPPELSLIVAGRVYHEPYYALLRRMAEGKDVRFVLDADDDALLALYRSAGVFVQASTTRDVYGHAVAKPELMGLSTIEAMACGLPAAVADVGSLPELVPDARFGRVFAGDAALGAILREVAAGTWPAQDANGLARRHVVERHGMRTIGARVAAFYRAVAAGARRAA